MLKYQINVYNIDVIVLDNILVIEFLWKFDFFKQFIFTKTMPIIELKSYSNIQTELQFQFNIIGVKSNQIIEQSNIQVFELQIIELFWIQNCHWNQFTIFHFCQNKCVKFSKKISSIVSTYKIRK